MNAYWRDALLHLVAGYPIYQLLGTLRHELSHVVACWLAGYGMKDIRLLPFVENGTFYWGRVIPAARSGARLTIHMYLAPYYMNAISSVIWAALAYALWQRREVIANITQLDYNLMLGLSMLLLVSPVVDTLYNLYKFVRFKRGDFARAYDYYKLH